MRKPSLKHKVAANKQIRLPFKLHRNKQVSSKQKLWQTKAKDNYWNYYWFTVLH